MRLRQILRSAMLLPFILITVANSDITAIQSCDPSADSTCRVKPEDASGSTGNMLLQTKSLQGRFVEQADQQTSLGDDDNNNDNDDNNDDDNNNNNNNNDNDGNDDDNNDDNNDDGDDNNDDDDGDDDNDDDGNDNDDNNGDDNDNDDDGNDDNDNDNGDKEDDNNDNNFDFGNNNNNDIPVPPKKPPPKGNNDDNDDDGNNNDGNDNDFNNNNDALPRPENPFKGLKKAVKEVIEEELQDLDKKIDEIEGHKDGIIKVGKVAVKNQKYLKALYSGFHGGS